MHRLRKKTFWTRKMYNKNWHSAAKTTNRIEIFKLRNICEHPHEKKVTQWISNRLDFLRMCVLYIFRFSIVLTSIRHSVNKLWNYHLKYHSVIMFLNHHLSLFNVKQYRQTFRILSIAKIIIVITTNCPFQRYRVECILNEKSSHQKHLFMNTLAHIRTHTAYMHSDAIAK